MSLGRADCFDCFNRCCNLTQLLTRAKHVSYTDPLHCNLPASLRRVEKMGDSAMSMVLNAKMQDRRRTRPLTAMQERLFFGALFVIAALIQVAAVWVQFVG
jgi:hypothetical protein